MFVGRAVQYSIHSAPKPGTQSTKSKEMTLRTGAIGWTRGEGGGGGQCWSSKPWPTGPWLGLPYDGHAPSGVEVSPGTACDISAGLFCSELAAAAFQRPDALSPAPPPAAGYSNFSDDARVFLLNQAFLGPAEYPERNSR